MCLFQSLYSVHVQKCTCTCICTCIAFDLNVYWTFVHVGGDETPPSGGIDSTPRSRLTRKNERGETPLHIACIKGDVKTATSLINQGAGVNEADNAGG